MGNGELSFLYPLYLTNNSGQLSAAVTAHGPRPTSEIGRSSRRLTELPGAVYWETRLLPARPLLVRIR
jgi:hypothetical protein